MSRNFTELLNPTGAELVPTYAQQQSTPLWLSLSGFLSYFQTNFTSSTYLTTISTPGDGFSINIEADGQSRWALLRPTGTLATGTIVLPAIGVAADGQEIIISSTEVITSFTVDKNDATAVYGAPTSMAVGDKFTLRYNTQTTSWY